MIVIIDYGLGNLRSVLNKLNRLRVNAIISSKVEDIKNATKLILPGVGHFAMGMKNLREYGLINILNDKVLVEKVPILGICLGMQLLSEFSEEGATEGLRWIKAKTIRFNLNNGYKIPHMGWNSLDKRKDSILLNNINNDELFYFVHSYHLKCENEKDVLATTEYGTIFISAIQKDNIFGTQFHPEKSHDAGSLILNNFIKM